MQYPLCVRKRKKPAGCRLDKRSLTGYIFSAVFRQFFGTRSPL